VYQTSIGYLGVRQIQRFERAQPFSTFWPNGGDLGAEEMHVLNLVQRFELLQPSIGDLGIVHVYAIDVEIIVAQKTMHPCWPWWL